MPWNTNRNIIIFPRFNRQIDSSIEIRREKGRTKVKVNCISIHMNFVFFLVLVNFLNFSSYSYN